MPFVPARAAAFALAVSLAAAPALAASDAPAQAAPAAAPAATAAPAAAENPVVAVVNGKEIRRAEMEELRATIPQLQNVPLEMVYEQLLDHMINSELILAEAKKAKLQDDPEVKQQIRELEKRVMQAAWLSRKADETLTDAELRKKYDELVKAMPPREEVKARHILVEKEDEAKAVIEELKKGGKFEEIAKAKSKDGAAAEGGDLGWFTKDQMVPEFSEAAFAMKAGDVSQTPVKTQFGYHVIKVEDKRNQAPPKFEDIKDQLKEAAGQDVRQKLVQELREKAEVKRFNPDGSPIAQEQKKGEATPAPATPAATPAAAPAATPAAAPAATPAAAPAAAPAVTPAAAPAAETKAEPAKADAAPAAAEPAKKQ